MSYVNGAPILHPKDLTHQPRQIRTEERVTLAAVPMRILLRSAKVLFAVLMRA